MHIDENALERLSAGHSIEEEELRQIEEHLLLCSLCQDRLTDWDDYIKHIRASLKALGTRST